jgi:thiamine biosynthesis protein ThiS
MITVNGKKIDWKEGLTIRAIFSIMKYDYPLITVTVNDEVVAPSDFDSHTVKDGDDVSMLHICHGG